LIDSQQQLTARRPVIIGIFIHLDAPGKLVNKTVTGLNDMQENQNFFTF